MMNATRGYLRLAPLIVVTLMLVVAGCGLEFGSRGSDQGSGTQESSIRESGSHNEYSGSADGGVDSSGSSSSPSEASAPPSGESKTAPEPVNRNNDESGSWFQAAAYPVGTSPDSVTAADLDGDGDADLATANTFSDNGYGDETGDISVLRNEGDGTLAEAVNYPVMDAPASVAAADLDGDGDTDLASANNFTSNVTVLINEGDGTFAGGANYPVGDRPASIIAADLDGDGDTDLATGNGIADNPNSNNVSVLLSKGDGTFAEAVNYPVGENTFSVTAADLDGDGDGDLVAANANSNNISVLINKGDGEFAESVEYSSGEGTSYATAADLDGDGDTDLASANSGSNDVRVFMNKGDGTFAEAVSYSTKAGTLAVTAADLDGDNDPDLAAANFNADNVSILLNKGDGTFADDVTYPVGSYPDSITSSDLDSDGDIDLATANNGSNDVSVLINTTGMGGDAGSSDDSEEASLDQAVGDYYRAAGAEDWAYTYDHLDSQTRSMFTEEEWSRKNQWFWDRNQIVYHILSIEPDGNSEGSVADVEVRITGEDGSSWTRTTYFVQEDGEWKHRFSQEETDLFMPDATFEEFVKAQTDTSSEDAPEPVADGVCDPLSGGAQDPDCPDGQQEQESGLLKFDGSWWMHGIQMNILSDATSSQIANVGPCTDPFEPYPSDAMCNQVLLIEFSEASSGGIIGTITEIRYETWEGDPPPSDFKPSSDLEVGDSFKLEFVDDNLLRTTWLGDAAHLNGQGNPYWCNSQTSDENIDKCGA